MPFLGLAWSLTVALGLSFMMLYQETPGVAATPSSQWPASSKIQLATDRPTLVLMAHPKCPCTRSCIGELNGLLASSHAKAKVYVLFLKPKGTPKNWEKTDLWRSAAAIPGVQPITDEDGIEARRFHAATSGQTLLFSQAGQLLFNGGITAGRGHSGDNAGRDAVVSLLDTGKAKRHKTPVFGCSLVTYSTLSAGGNGN